MIYEYVCTNIYCEKCDEVVEKDIPMLEIGRDIYCEICKRQLQRVYSSFVAVTGDGRKDAK